MIGFEYTHPDLWYNIGIDEAILESAESNTNSGKFHPELFRLWESDRVAVVLGRSSPFNAEVNHEFCRNKNIPVVRRCSGGQSVVIGPGCLMYAVLLSYENHPELRMLDAAHEFVMGKMREALDRLEIATEMRGTCDLTFHGRKFSGNSLRCKRNWMLYHGTMICGLDPEMIENCLLAPVRQPEYRGNRNHRDFVTQLPVSIDSLRQSLRQTWNVQEGKFDWPMDRTKELVNSKYRSDQWTRKVP